mmetsp:Transcript_15358/g.50443  ORF Transcript_15358/g.50443 Transcript_15358/m.50443 type:complete len:229 (+) Transcript_15358:208-894(+)
MTAPKPSSTATGCWTRTRYRPGSCPGLYDGWLWTRTPRAGALSGSKTRSSSQRLRGGRAVQLTKAVQALRTRWGTVAAVVVLVAAGAGIWPRRQPLPQQQAGLLVWRWPVLLCSTSRGWRSPPERVYREDRRTLLSLRLFQGRSTRTRRPLRQRKTRRLSRAILSSRALCSAPRARCSSFCSSMRRSGGSCARVRWRRARNGSSTCCAARCRPRARRMASLSTTSVRG